MWPFFICALLLVAARAQDAPPPSNATSTPVPNPNIVMGLYGLFYRNHATRLGADSVCSNYILHNGTANVNARGDMILARYNIFHMQTLNPNSGVTCGSNSMVLKYKPVSNVAAEVGKSDEVYEKINGTKANFWIGKEARTCGTGAIKWTLQNPTAYVLYYNPVAQINGLLGETLAPKQRYLIITNSFYTCIYRGTTFDPPGKPSKGDAALPTPEPPKIPTGEAESVCFPADASVLTVDGRRVRMDELRIGDRVHVGGGIYSDIFLFTHKDAAREHTFVALHTDDNRRLLLTAGHYVYVNGHLATAGTVRVGDMLRAADGKSAVRIRRVHTERRRGLYNPHTVHGDIAVDGIVTSTFTRTVEPLVAVGALAPLRALHRRVGIALRGLLDNGAHSLAKWLPNGQPEYLLL